MEVKKEENGSLRTRESGTPIPRPSTYGERGPKEVRPLSSLMHLYINSSLRTVAPGEPPPLEKGCVVAVVHETDEAISVSASE